MRISSIAFLSIFLLIIASIGVGAAPEYTQIDTNHDLTSDSSIDTYEESGVASADLKAPNMKITVAESKSDVNIEGSAFSTDVGQSYLRIDYAEDKDRVVRFYLPKEYFDPYSDQLEPVVGDSKADIEPVRDREYTSVKVELSGEQDEYVYSVSHLAGYSESARSGWLDRLDPTKDEEQTNTEAEEWQYIQSSEIGSETEIKVGSTDDYRAQYIKDSGEWNTIVESEQDDEPYYIRTREGVEDKIYVVSTQSETPQIRYKKSQSLIESGEDVSSGVKGIVSEIMSDINELI